MHSICLNQMIRYYTYQLLILDIILKDIFKFDFFYYAKNYHLLQGFYHLVVLKNVQFACLTFIPMRLKLLCQGQLLPIIHNILDPLLKFMDSKVDNKNLQHVKNAEKLLLHSILLFHLLLMKR